MAPKVRAKEAPVSGRPHDAERRRSVDGGGPVDQPPHRLRREVRLQERPHVVPVMGVEHEAGARQEPAEVDAEIVVRRQHEDLGAEAGQRRVQRRLIERCHPAA